MPAKDDTPVPAIKRDENGQLIHYGFEHQGAFHPFASEGAGNYDERIQAAKDAEE